MNNSLNCIKNYIVQAILSISIFNCKNINLDDKILNDKINELVKYINEKWSDEHV